jgi:hypothetical protein
MISPQTCLKVADDVTFQSMGPGQDAVVLALRSGNLFTCNQTAAAFLKALDGRRTIEQACDVVHRQFEVEPQRLRADMLELAGQMLASDLLLICETE